MQELCKILEINVNGLLSGESIEQLNYQKNAENNMLSLLEQRRDGKNKIILSVMAGFIAISVLVACVLIASYLQLTTPLKVLIIFFGVIIAVLALIIACVMDKNAGSFECPNCKHRFVPSTKNYVAGAHTITRRYLKCPHCGESGYCKHKLTK